MSIFTDFWALFGKKMTPHLLPLSPFSTPQLRQRPISIFHKKLAIRSMT